MSKQIEFRLPVPVRVWLKITNVTLWMTVAHAVARGGVR
jgi:hypothetical protein